MQNKLPFSRSKFNLYLYYTMVWGDQIKFATDKAQKSHSSIMRYVADETVAWNKQKMNSIILCGEKESIRFCAADAAAAGRKQSRSRSSARRTRTFSSRRYPHRSPIPNRWLPVQRSIHPRSDVHLPGIHPR